MMRITRITDYGIVLLSYFDGAKVLTTPSLAEFAQLPLPVVGKVLKALCRGGLLVSQRGASGGYRLARPAREISVAEVIRVLEGPIALTECSADAPGLCELEPVCPVRGNWQKISAVVRRALEGLTLAEMTRPAAERRISALTLVRKP